MRLTAGSRLGHYEIVGPIATGGMGEVYKAWDPSLRRPVALKILPPGEITTPDMLRRLVREARTASALNHPNIVTVYEIGEADVSDARVGFIAMELIEGETLRSLLSRSIDLPKALSYLAQIAEGLAKAHSAGIVHRDLKPENIMITPDGFAKILDFGLAKGVEPGAESRSTTVTGPAKVIGTVGYMSPEQLRGGIVDHRSDIFSLGCIVYEVLTRRNPFQGASAVDTFHKIVYEPPSPIGDVNPPVPDTLCRLMLKCLSKDPEERYQSAKEITIDLREIKRESTSGAHPVAEPGAARTPRRLLQGVWIAAALLILTTAAWLWTRRASGTDGPPRGGLESMTIERLPATSNVRLAAISNDGRYIALAQSSPDGEVLLVRQAATGSEIQLGSADGKSYGELSFSHDGEYVRYVHDGALRQSPVLGGPPKILIDKFELPVSFSPDGKRCAFVREGNVFVANSDGTGERRLTNATNHDRYSRAAWSPRGDVIACIRRSERRMDRGNAWAEILDLNGLSAKTSETPPARLGEAWFSMTTISWLPDATGIVVAATRRPLNERQLYEITYPEGGTRRLTNDLFEYEGASITGDGRVLVSRQTDRRSSIWLLDPRHPERAGRIFEGVGFIRHVTALPDGAVVYGASSEGNPDIWRGGIDGKRRIRLTDHPASDLMPSASPDGRMIAFISDRSGQVTIWIMNADGSRQRQLTTEGRDVRPRFSPDGRSIVYSATGARQSALRRVSVDGGKPETLSVAWGRVPAVSPDGQFIAALGPDLQLGVVSAGDGSFVRSFDEHGTSMSELRWTRDSRAIAFERNGVVYLQDLAGGPAQTIADLRPDEILSFDWMADNKSLLLARASSQHALVQLKNFR